MNISGKTRWTAVLCLILTLVVSLGGMTSAASPAADGPVELHVTERDSGRAVDLNGEVLVLTLGSFGVTGVSGDGSDIFFCTPGSLGGTTTCTWAIYWDGSAAGFSGEVTDSVSIIP